MKMAKDGAVLEVSGLTVEVATERGWVDVVDDVSFSVRAGETLGIVGESGSGKTVTSLAVMGLLPPSVARVRAGAVRLGGRDLVGMPRRDLEDVRGAELAMVFQEPMTSLNPAFTVGRQVAETVRRHRGCSRREAWTRAVELLGRVGIPDAASRVRAYPHEFSGGMRQRVMIAIAIACEPRLLIADEPTTALDVTVQAQILDLLAEMRDTLGMAMIVVTHDLGVVAEICDRLMVMYAGQVVEESPGTRFFARPLHPYGEGLLAAMPRLGSAGGEPAVIPGRPPLPWQQPRGCRFMPRCPYRRSGCEDGQRLVRDAEDRAHRCVRGQDLELRGTI